MKIFLVLILALSFYLTGCNNKQNNIQEDFNNYSASRTISNEQFINNSITNRNDTNVINNIQNNNNTNVNEELSSFSTKIYTPDDEARQTNIRITCSKLNGTIVKSGETFSFCNTVGKATPEEGYEKADIFDKDGNVTKGYGRWKLPN